MSDPVTNAEVEDVLSSIRRLVSEDKRPLHTALRENANDRLVLTPALRVAEDVEPVPAETQAHDTSEPEFPNASAVEAVFDDPAHDYDADPYNFDDETDQTGELDAAQFLDPRPDEDTDHVVEDGANEAAEATPEAETSVNSDDQAHDAYSEGHTDDGANTDGAHGDHDHVDNSPSEHEAYTAEEGAFDPLQESSESDHDDAHGQADAEQSPTSKADVLRAKITELEAVIGTIASSWDVKTDDDDAPVLQSDDAMAWEDASPEDAIASKLHEYDPDAGGSDENDVMLMDGIEVAMPFEPEQAQAETSVDHDHEHEPEETASGLDDLDDSQLIDEEALRDMVSEIVRQELQGALGERITRNVRKLVRREIHRALTAQELE
jgi:hypothetical protein